MQSQTLIYESDPVMQPQDMNFNHLMPAPQYNSYGIQVNQPYPQNFSYPQQQYFQPVQTPFGAMPLPSHMRNQQTQPMMTFNIQTNTKGAVPLSQLSSMMQSQKLMPQPGSHRNKKPPTDSEEAPRKKGKKQNTESQTPKGDRKARPNNGGSVNPKGLGKDSNKNLYLKYKTAICRHYEQTGICQLGKMCNFAHGSDEKRNMNDPLPKTFPGKQYIGVLHSNYKTQFCNNFKTQGHCKFGINCCFAHGDHELRQLTDPMPIVPPAVLYYGPPNMKVNPADIKVMTHSEEEMYVEQYPYYEGYYDDMERQFIDQYQDIFDQQNPLQQQPVQQQEQMQHPTESNLFYSQSQEAFPELQIQIPEPQPAAKKNPKERKNKVVRQDVSPHSQQPTLNNSPSSGQAEQALMDDAKNSHQDIQLTASDEAQIEEVNQKLQSENLPNVAESQNTTQLKDAQGPSDDVNSTKNEQTAEVKSQLPIEEIPQVVDNEQTVSEPEAAQLEETKQIQSKTLDNVNPSRDEFDDNLLSEEEDHQMPEEVFEYTSTARSHKSRFFTEEEIESKDSQDFLVSAIAFDSIEPQADKAKVRTSDLRVSISALPLDKVMPTQSGGTPVSSERADVVDDDSPNCAAVPQHQAITMSPSFFTATGESGLSPKKIKREV